ncbi:uncharacterized protein A483_HHAL011955 [Halyomorpha halys]|nr:uncharacterized protein LOC106684179 [Halyomorpha halys]KAE8573325.1 uncharacterized protein A483_HHAL011955 [Halyomorpha halys]
MIAAFALVLLVAGTMAQRSPYLSSSQQEYPGLLNRFKPAASANGLGDRIGAPAEEKPVPVGGANGTLYDQETVNRVASWPVDKQPFWFKNRQQIAQHTGATQNASSSGQ